MPAKSRRNRRKISQGSQTTLNSTMNNTTGTLPVETARIERTVNVNNPSARVAASQVVTYPYFLSEIKWISLVTVIVAVILVILYIFLG
jgi:hypothetical protein